MRWMLAYEIEVSILIPLFCYKAKFNYGVKPKEVYLLMGFDGL